MANQLLTFSRIDEKMLQSIATVTEPTRLRILFLLGEQRRMCVGDIASHFHISRPAVSHHLKILKDIGLVLSQKSGQEIYYTVDTRNMVVMLRNLADSLDQCCPNDKTNN